MNSHLERAELYTYLSPKEEAKLTTHLEQELHLTDKSIAAYIKKRWQVNCSDRSVVALLHRLGFYYKKPKLIPGKADKILFMDAGSRKALNLGCGATQAVNAQTSWGSELGCGDSI